MDDIIKKWTLFANADLDAASRLFKSPKPNSWTYLLCSWHCHQAIEKIIKMLIIKKEKELLKIHDLLKLSQLAEIKPPLNYKNFIEELNKFYLRSRYPDIFYKPLPNPNKNEIQDILNKTKKLFLWLKKQ